MKKGDKKWYKSWSNWFILIACIILIPVLIMNLSIMMQAKKDKDTVPSVFGIKPFMVLSGSMETEIQIGDLILTRVVDPSTLKVDDVIAFRDGEGTVTTHRIIDIVIQEGVTYFITKGDNNNSQDKNLVEFKDVEGIYIGRIPGVGSLMKSLSEPTTILVIVVGITIVFVIGFMISYRKQQERDRKEFLEYKKRLQENEEVKIPQEIEKKEESEEELEEKAVQMDFLLDNQNEEEEPYALADYDDPNELDEPEEFTNLYEYEETKEEKVEDSEQEFLEYKKMKEEQERKKQEDKEYQEFLEYKRMKREQEEQRRREQEEREFLEFKKYKEEQEKKNSKDE